MRLICDDEQEANKAYRLIYGHPGVSVRKPRQGTNPKYADDQNGAWLNQHPELDALAIQWGYQTRVHSPEASDLYFERTGLRLPPPAN